MDVSFFPDGDAFRQEVRALICDRYSPEMRVQNPYTDLTKPRMLLCTASWAEIVGISDLQSRPRVPPRL